MSKVRPDELDTETEGEQPFVLDIHPREDYQAKHIDGSHNLPEYHDLRSGDEGAVTGVDDDSVLYRIELETGETADFRGHDLRPPIDQ